MSSCDSSNPFSGPAVDEAVRDEARAWVVRHDRGLEPAEQAAFDAWLRADPQHAAAWKRSAATWNLLDEATPVAAEESFPAERRSLPGWVLGGLAAAAAVAIGLAGWWQLETAKPAVAEVQPRTGVSAPRVAVLSDGTMVFLNAGSEVAERFTPAERRVLLLRGEAHFDVAKNEAWPFVVRAGSVEVRAVGTAFNVQLQAGLVDVRVTEGRVRVSPDVATIAADGPISPPAAVPLVSAGERVVVEFVEALPSRVEVTTMGPAQLTETAAWQEPLMRLGGGKTLALLAEEFRQREGRTLTLADPELKALRVGGQIRADNLEGFVWLMESVYGLKAERAPDNGLILRKAPEPAKP